MERPSAARAAAAAGRGKHWLVLNAHLVVDLGYGLATAPSHALRPAGLALLRGLTRRLRSTTDPDVDDDDAGLMEQFQVRSIHWSPYDPVGVVNADP
jgi:hypothetical protein